ncbi:PepSY-like domain-containing protein [uncultured Brachyspira sp.]|uniref:PepSY-like domain-containing protein n=1 Tax=uncultured Brachyspira sp. TaxID=221953 RepID=UPI0026374ADA|nr:PepSY-like domain-containing protein [uncultured Brachyspira sp.]
MMKKLYLFLLFLSFFSCGYIFFYDDSHFSSIPYENLPDISKEFIENNFKDYTVHNTLVSRHYIVTFKGGSSIQFNFKGEWINIIGNRNTISFETASKFIPSNIINILKSKYSKINSIYKKSKGYQFKVDDAIIVSFDNEGNIK